ncbi:FHA domain-containing protein [Shimia sp.]|uniref:FHA domain-containing protein n=1 Tax=Shimia sp. TaxID=1954381 RepID=UPI00329762EE
MKNGLTAEPVGLPDSTPNDVRAFLENLTGTSRGQIVWLSSDQSHVYVGTDRALRISSNTATFSSSLARAMLSWSGETYEIEAISGSDIWVNGRKIGTAHLLHGDTIEFGEDGPISRFRLCGNTFPTSWPVEEILGDAVAYARTSRRSIGPRLSNALFYSLRRILLESTIAFRVTVILVLIVLTTFVTWQYRSDILLQQSIQKESLRLEAIATALSEWRQLCSA